MTNKSSEGVSQKSSSARRCAYCGKSTVLTREHLWPASILRQVQEETTGSGPGYWLLKLEQPFKTDPTVKDVCAECNNGVLSTLDNYMSGLFKSTLSHMPERGEQVKFTFDYHLLKRSLLKISYNSARINQSFDDFAFPPLLPYIMGQNDAAGKSVQLYVQLTYPGRIPPHLLKEALPEEVPPIFYPRVNRVGHVLIKHPNGQRRILRAVHFRSYSFVLALFKPDEAARVRQELESNLPKWVHGVKLLRSSRPSEQLICDGMDAWEAFSRSCEFRLPIGDERPK